jgi:hypothetical protein
MSNYTSDCQTGFNAEDRFAEIMTNYGWTSTISDRSTSVTEYDIISQSPTGKVLTFEVKHDRKTETGNVAIERGRINRSVIYPSGISSTQAGFWAITPDGQNFYVCLTADLKNLLLKYNRQVRGGDNNSIMYLVPFEAIKKISKKVS